MTDQKKSNTSNLDFAPEEVKLAVDLIQLLEENNIEVDTTIKALEIVLRDFKNKLKNTKH